ncbi:MAG TPA: MFS transporter [Allosphingosinicella sp.]|nr:MFS transporter [Allosphingosinicella sp.]
MHSEADAPPPRGLVGRLFSTRPGELPAVLAGFALFFLLFASYFMLRPVRETFGVDERENLHLLWTGTFIASLAVIPLYGWLSRAVPRRALLPATYVVASLVMAGFAFVFRADPDNVWAARAFYIWVSVMNLFVVSVAWSLMADVFGTEQGRRLFGQLAAGASLGGLAGPLLSGFLVEPLGHTALMFISVGLMLLTLPVAGWLLAWRARHGRPDDPDPPEQRIGGSAWAGLGLILRSPWLLGISLFVILLTSVTTFLYFEQARIVGETFTDRTERTQVFAAIDATVQALTIVLQLFVTGQLARRLGVTVLLTAVPILMIFGFGALALAATFPVLVGAMILRRVGEYAFIRVGREMLFTRVDAETKYKAKNAIDTFVYRGGDLLSAWASAGLTAIGSSLLAALGGMAIAVAWAVTGFMIGRREDKAVAARRG